MAIYFEERKRLIIPRWRKFNPAHVTSEHAPVLNQRPPTAPAHTDVVQRKIADWNVHRNTGYAWELVNSAFINREFQVAREAARFLRENVTKLSKQLQIVIKAVLEEDLTEKPAPEKNVVQVKGLLESTKREIRETKRKISYYLRSEYLWLELARLYSIIGNLPKAEQCIGIGLHFSNDQNRFFLRGASRFYHHIGKYDEAQSVIRRSPALKRDPWLLSADISYANKMGRFAVNAKSGVEMLESKSYSNQSISELAGVLATMELKNASVKKAKKFTQQSLLAPNDNSLAQAEWISREVNDISLQPWIDKIDQGFEARAFEYLYNKRYEVCLSEAMKWVIDQPFSKRAAHFVTFFCTALTDNYETAIEVGQLGADCNPDYFPIWNNLGFAQVSAGDLHAARGTLERLNGLAKTDREKCFALATTGFYYYRSKESDIGRELYREAIEIATKTGMHDVRDLAAANLMRESCLSGEVPLPMAMDALKGLKAKDPGLAEQIDHMVADISKAYYRIHR
jgi:tetratricopeptide (TPR) repeat protein